jgi:putative DNA primase/helicase
MKLNSDDYRVHYSGPKKPPEPELPELVIDGSNVTETAKQLAKLFAQHQRFLFNGHQLVEIVAETGNMPRAIIVTNEAVRVFAHEICTPVRIVKGKTILASDGSFRTGSGYDEATGMWCHDIPAVHVPEQPNRAQAKASLDVLREFFRTFAFADAERIMDTSLGVDVVNPDAPIGLDESSFLVSLMTAVCRASLPLAPGILAAAPAFSGAGTGKGLATKAICIIASGAPPSAFTSGHDAEEMDKRLTAALTEARPAIFLDNYNGKDLTSDILASALTESLCEVRPMGHTIMVRLHTRTLVAMTGNDVQIAEDMARRIIRTDYDAKVENPELRPFKPGFLDSVHAERATLLGHALTIWRWGRQNADLLRGKPLGSYEIWAQWCRDPLINLGARDPVDRLAAIKAADPKRKNILTVFETWWAAHQDKLLPAKDLDQSVIQAIDGKAGFRDGEFRYSRQFVARWQSHINTRVGGYVLTSIPIGPDSKPVAHYKLTPTDQ